MATNVNNILLNNISGSIGPDHYTRMRGGKTYIVRKPVRGKDRKPKPLEKAGWDRFRNAQQYAKQLKFDAGLKALYTPKIKGAQSEYNLAISDAMGSPVVSAINTNAYTGKPGDTISVKARDNFRVAKVLCRIEQGRGKLVEEGEAKLSGGYDEWTYTATKQIAAGKKCTIRFTAFDHPGNSSSISTSK